MYLKVHSEGNQWFRDDNGTLVGKTVQAYAQIYYGGKTPIIETTEGNYVKPVYGRIDAKSKKFITLCDGIITHLCVGKSCRAFSSPICPYNNSSQSDGYYIVVDKKIKG